MLAPEVFICTAIILVWSAIGIVRGGVITVTDVFVPLQLCHKAMYLYGLQPDDPIAKSIINSLISLEQPFKCYMNRHPKEMRLDKFTSAARWTCLAHIVLTSDSPMARKMNFLLKRFNRARGNENDFVLVFARTEDGTSKRTDWRAGSLKYVMPRNFPDNALLIELDQSTESENGGRRYHVLGIYALQLYCNEVQEVCWRALSVPRFPKHKNEFDAAFSRERAQGRCNYNRWPMQIGIDALENIQDVAAMTFRQATLGRYTWNDYTLGANNAYNAPTIWLTYEIANHVNATFQPISQRRFLEQRTEIQPWQQLHPQQALKTHMFSRNVYLKFGFIVFGYCTNGTEGGGNTSMFAFFTPLDSISWILLVLVMVAIAVLGWFAGHGFELFQLASCLGSQSFNVDSNGRLAVLLILWHLVAFVVFNCYLAFLESVLAVPVLLPRIQDFKTLNENCEIPWLLSSQKANFEERFQDIKHLKALFDRSKGTTSTIEPWFFRKILEHQNQCVIYQTDTDSTGWADVGRKFEPGATCSMGKEKLMGDPVIWHINPPNAAVIYRTVRALEATGFLMKFEEYFYNRRKQKTDHFVRDRLQRRYDNVTENTNEEPSGVESSDGFTMENIKMVFYGYLILSSFAIGLFLVEFVQQFVEISCTYV